MVATPHPLRGSSPQGEPWVQLPACLAPLKGSLGRQAVRGGPEAARYPWFTTSIPSGGVGYMSVSTAQAGGCAWGIHLQNALDKF